MGKKEQRPYVAYDDDERKEYLLGFHKRKMQRKAYGYELQAKKDREEKKRLQEERKEARLRSLGYEVKSKQQEDFDMMLMLSKLELGESIVDALTQSTLLGCIRGIRDEDGEEEEDMPQNDRIEYNQTVVEVKYGIEEELGMNPVDILDLPPPKPAPAPTPTLPMKVSEKIKAKALKKPVNRRKNDVLPNVKNPHRLSKTKKVRLRKKIKRQNKDR